MSTALDEISFELSRPAKASSRARANSVYLGAAGEKWADLQHQAMALRGVARMRKLNPPTIVVRGRLQFGRKSDVDYGGYLLGGEARHVAVECKSFAGDRLAFSEVKEHQRALLDRAHADGCVVVLLMIELRSDAQGNALPYMQAAYAVPWWRVRALVGDRGSVLVRDVAQHRVPAGALYLEPWVTW